MAGFMEAIEEHPAFISLLVLGVALLAYFQSRNQTAPAAYTIAGAPSDTNANAAAIQEAAISAGSQNLATVASLIGLENSNNASENVANTQTAAAVSINKTNTDAAVTAARINAGLQAGIANANTAAVVTMNRDNNQTGKDIARAADNTSIVNNITGVVGSVLKFFHL